MILFLVSRAFHKHSSHMMAPNLKTWAKCFSFAGIEPATRRAQWFCRGDIVSTQFFLISYSFNVTLIPAVIINYVKINTYLILSPF